jgi:hypothetical protein
MNLYSDYSHTRHGFIVSFCQSLGTFERQQAESSVAVQLTNDRHQQGLIYTQCRHNDLFMLMKNITARSTAAGRSKKDDHPASRQYPH